MKSWLILLLIFGLNIKAQEQKRVPLFFASNIDSVNSFLEHNVSYRDSIIKEIVEVDESRPYHTPDIDVVLIDEGKVAILLLDDKKNLIKAILNEELKKGHYLIYLNAKKLRSLFDDYRHSERFVFMYLVLTDSTHEYQKWVFMK